MPIINFKDPSDQSTKNNQQVKIEDNDASVTANEPKSTDKITSAPIDYSISRAPKLDKNF